MSKNLFEIWLEEAQADLATYQPQLEEVEEQLGETPLDPELQERHRILKWYVDSLETGIEMLKRHLGRA